MKYIAISSYEELRGFPEMDRAELVKCAEGRTTWLINTEDSTFFSVKKNAWLPFKDSTDLDSR